jgi:hypothetical protein
MGINLSDYVHLELDFIRRVLDVSIYANHSVIFLSKKNHSVILDISENSYEN